MVPSVRVPLYCILTPSPFLVLLSQLAGGGTRVSISSSPAATRPARRATEDTMENFILGCGKRVNGGSKSGCVGRSEVNTVASSLLSADGGLVSGNPARDSLTEAKFV